MIYNDYRLFSHFSYQENQIKHDKSKEILRKISVGKTPSEAELDLLDRITTIPSSSTTPIKIIEVIAEKKQ